MFLKTLGPNGTVITMVSWKAGSRTKRQPAFFLLLPWRPSTRKWCPKGAFLKIMKIENGTKIQLFIKVQHLDPLKTVLGSGFEKTLKTTKKLSGNQWFLMVQNNWKVLKNKHFLLILGHSKKQWKNYLKRVPKSNPKATQNDHWAVKVRFIHRYYRFWPLLKKKTQ